MLQLICVITERKQKQFLFVKSKLSGDFFIFKQVIAKQTGQTRQSTIFSNFAKRSLVLIFFTYTLTDK